MRAKLRIVAEEIKFFMRMEVMAWMIDDVCVLCIYFLLSLCFMIMLSYS